MFIIMGRTCRFTRWDRSGIIVTEPLDYCERWQLFCNILWRMSRCSDEQLGYDSTAHRLLPHDPLYQAMDDAAKTDDSDMDHRSCKIELSNVLPSSFDQPVIYRYVRDLFRESLSRNAPRYLLHVPDGDKSHQYLVSRPVCGSSSVIGSGTKGFAALERRTGQFVWLKDCWRPVYIGSESEGDILRELNDTGVPHVPTVLCYGDLPEQTTLALESLRWAHEQESICHPDIDFRDTLSLSEQVWRSNQREIGVFRIGPTSLRGNGVTDTSRLSFDEAHGPPCLRQHARMVVREVCLPLKHFSTGKSLVNVIFDCLKAHRMAASGPAARLHRDINTSNIMMIPQLARHRDGCGAIVWKGLLCNWEMSERIGARMRVQRQPMRYGTWQYASVALLNDHGKTAEISDELEAFLHVLVYHTVRYLNSNLEEAQVGSFIDEYFDEFLCYGNKWRCGFRKEAVMSNGVLRTGDGTIVRFGSHMGRLLRTLLRWFRANYVVREYESELKQAASPTPPRLPKPDEHDEGEATRASGEKEVEHCIRPLSDATSNQLRALSIDTDFSDDSTDRVPTEKEYKDAAKVQTHDALIELLRHLLDLTWREDRDPSGDRYPTTHDHDSAHGRRLQELQSVSFVHRGLDYQWTDDTDSESED
ncbi:hypothetical protein C8Q73DRAFT_780650 [Cubamyces lactineus]|nr:hypothetical protein C8Q73DRAFT_780650 [Cubamyces lactineus]